MFDIAGQTCYYIMHIVLIKNLSKTDLSGIFLP